MQPGRSLGSFSNYFSSPCLQADRATAFLLLYRTAALLLSDLTWRCPVRFGGDWTRSDCDLQVSGEGLFGKLGEGFVENGVRWVERTVCVEVVRDGCGFGCCSGLDRTQHYFPCILKRMTPYVYFQIGARKTISLGEIPASL
jgi:hypothetical protein